MPQTQAGKAQQGKRLKLHLHKEAEVGEHGEAAVLELLHTQLSEGIGIVSKAQRVEGATCNTSRHMTFS